MRKKGCIIDGKKPSMLLPVAAGSIVRKRRVSEVYTSSEEEMSITYESDIVNNPETVTAPATVSEITASETVTVSNYNTSEWDDDINVSDFVIINYEGEIFPGKVIRSRINNSETEFRVHCYKKVNPGWKIDNADIAWYSRDEIPRKISGPTENKQCVSGTRMKCKNLSFDDAELQENWGH